MNFQKADIIKIEDLDISDPVKKIIEEAINLSDFAHYGTDNHHYYTDMPSHEHYRDS